VSTRELTSHEQEELNQLQWELAKIRHEMLNGIPQDKPYTRAMSLDKINTQLFENRDVNKEV